MQTLTHHEVTMLLLSLGILLGVARVLGEVAQRIHQPAVVGEIFAGILLGPTVFGQLAPQWSADLFPAEGAGAVVLDGLTLLAITLFLLVAGMEVDLSTVWRQGGTAVRVGLCSVCIPFAVGFAVASGLSEMLGRQADVDATLFALFFAIAVSISALPIVAKILMDLNLYRSDFGMIVMAACVLNDLIGWIMFAVILGMAGQGADLFPVYATIGLILAFVVLILTAGRWAFDRLIPWLQAYTHWPGGVLGFAMTLALFGAAFTEWIGIHAILGSFMVGVAIGDSSHLREQTRMVIDQFVSFIFAPLFFASIGLRIDFLSNFDLSVVLTVLACAAVGKFGGCLLGARWAGMNPRESLAVGFSMISVGTMGIIIGLIALRIGLIQERLFVALVIMALSTSIISGPMVQASLNRRKPRHLVDLLTPGRYIHRLQGTTRREVLVELTALACTKTSLNQQAVEQAVLAREEMMHTGIGHGLALPHARIPELSAPIVTLGLSEVGLDFDAPDGEPAHIVFLILTPVDDNGAQLEIMASIAGIFRDRSAVDRVLRAGNLTELKALLKSTTGGNGD